MKCNAQQTIKVPELNSFTLVLPLKTRTFVSDKPIDDPIVYADLEGVVFKIGNRQYDVTLEEDGVHAYIEDGLKKGTYDIVLTATYHGALIRAAYFEGLISVSWNYMSDAQQYLTGSPIVMDAAFVIGGPLTDAELEELKEEYREKNAQLQQAIEDAEEAKREWEEKAADLDGVAQESTSQDILTAVENIDIDTSDLAKEATLQGVGADAAAAKTAAQNAETAAGQAKTAAEAAQTAVSALPTLQQMINAGIIPLSYDGIEMAAGVTVESAFDLVNKRNSIIRITDNVISALPQYINNNNYTSLIELNAYNVYDIYGSFRNAQTLQIVRVSNLTSATNLYLSFNSCQQLRVIDMSNVPSGISYYNPFVGSNKIIDIICGSNFTTNCAFLGTWSPTEALLNNSTSLVGTTETFTSNLEKLLYNIREHMAANLPDRTGLSSLTITFSAAVKAAILADAPTLTAFTNKNWTIA